MQNYILKSRFFVFFVIGIFAFMMFSDALPQKGSAFIPPTEQGKEARLKATVQNGSTGVATEGTGEKASFEKSSDESQPVVVEQESAKSVVKKKKKFPWLLVGAGALVAAVVIYYFLVAKKKYTLTTTMDSGVTGTPAAGAVKYKKGEVVSYNYSLASGYMNLSVTLDGAPVAASGTVTMDKNHALAASASQSFTLTVTKKAGVNGTPKTGTYSYAQGTVVAYSYAAASGFAGLVVKLDGAAVAASGTVTMNASRSLSAEVPDVFTLTVVRYDWVNGSPVTGTYVYVKGTQLNYLYSLKSMSIFDTLKVRLDGQSVAPAGTVKMNADHTLESWAWHCIFLPINSDNKDGFEDPTFHISEINDWVGPAANIMAGFVATNVSIPKNAPLIKANFTFYREGQGHGPFKISGFAEDNAAVFVSGGANKPSTRPETAQSTFFPTDWPNDAHQVSPDLVAILAEIIARPNWKTGNGIGIKISNPTASNYSVGIADYSDGLRQNSSIMVVYSTRLVGDGSPKEEPIL